MSFIFTNSLPKRTLTNMNNNVSIPSLKVHSLHSLIQLSRSASIVTYPVWGLGGPVFLVEVFVKRTWHKSPLQTPDAAFLIVVLMVRDTLKTRNVSLLTNLYN